MFSGWSPTQHRASREEKPTRGRPGANRLPLPVAWGGRRMGAVLPKKGGTRPGGKKRPQRKNLLSGEDVWGGTRCNEKNQKKDCPPHGTTWSNGRTPQFAKSTEMLVPQAGKIEIPLIWSEGKPAPTFGAKNLGLDPSSTRTETPNAKNPPATRRTGTDEEKTKTAQKNNSKGSPPTAGKT